MLLLASLARVEHNGASERPGAGAAVWPAVVIKTLHCVLWPGRRAGMKVKSGQSDLFTVQVLLMNGVWRGRTSSKAVGPL